MRVWRVAGAGAPAYPETSATATSRNKGKCEKQIPCGDEWWWDYPASWNFTLTIPCQSTGWPAASSAG